MAYLGYVRPTPPGNFLLRSIVIAALVGLLASCRFGSAEVYPCTHCRGRVLDAETGKPLAGAVVLMYWMQKRPGIAHPVETFLAAKEVETQADGSFDLDTSELPRPGLGAELGHPGIVIYMPGYADFNRNQKTPKPPGGIVKGLARGDLVVRLPRLKTREERLEELGLLPPAISHGEMPRLIHLLNVERRELGLSEYPEGHGEAR